MVRGAPSLGGALDLALHTPIGTTFVARGRWFAPRQGERSTLAVADASLLVCPVMIGSLQTAWILPCAGVDLRRVAVDATAAPEGARRTAFRAAATVLVRGAIALTPWLSLFVDGSVSMPFGGDRFVYQGDRPEILHETSKSAPGAGLGLMLWF